jgi:hypothetical protein
MTSVFLAIIIMFMGISTSVGFLNKIQLKYTKFILGSPDVADDIKHATREILLENYQPWLRKQYKSFIRQNAKTMNRIYVRELYQYAVYGLLESLQAYNGSAGLHKYAEKFVYGQMYKGINDLSIMKPVSLSQAKKGDRVLKPKLVSYDEYWLFDKLRENGVIDTHSDIVEDIQEIMQCSPGEYSRLFYLRYDCCNLGVIRSISDICQMESYSEETYRKKINKILQYIRSNLHNN